MSATSLPDVTAPVLETPSVPGPVGPSPSPFFAHLYRLTVKQYDQMVEAGVFGEQDRVELIQGMLVAKMGRNRPHIVSGKKSLRALQGIIPPGWHVAKEDPATVSESSKPEPDLAVVRGQPEDYIDRDVTAADITLVAEIADSSLRADQREMKQIYAAGKIPVYWIIDLVDRRLEVFSDPDGERYRRSEVFSVEQEVPMVLAGVEVGRIRVADLMP